MVGHIALPAYMIKQDSELKETEILPTSLFKEMIQGLLRNEMGFRRLIVTDASHMGGLLGAMPRRRQVPEAIAVGNIGTRMRLHFSLRCLLTWRRRLFCRMERRSVCEREGISIYEESGR